MFGSSEGEESREKENRGEKSKGEWLTSTCWMFLKLSNYGGGD